MALISFAMTVDEFLSGEKTCTRRDWSDNYRKLWQKWWDEGKYVHTAYDKNPRNSGKVIGHFMLTKRPYREKLCNMPESDLMAEGNICETRESFFRLIGKTPDDIVTVVRFKKLEEE